MPLQNRADPFGDIHAVAARGMFTGNRGVIHDPATRTLLRRRWTTKAWIICACSYKDRPPRDVMGRNGRDGGAGWTELFFLDEVTALAAGHRPCFLCRREAATRFLGAFGRAFGIDAPKAPQIDARLHAERLASRNSGEPMPIEEPATLPDGAMISAGGDAFAIRDGVALRWTFDGYEPAGRADALAGKARLITPPTTVAILRAGYAPVWEDVT
jgi:hypothetical protein